MKNCRNIPEEALFEENCGFFRKVLVWG